jgi:NAD(P)-dependent dehydrogenase (short-subunit alcohol dehydrogenase family)
MSLAVVNIAIILSFCCIAMTCAYCARKYTIVGPYKYAMKELAGKDTRVNAIAPQVKFFDSCD